MSFNSKERVRRAFAHQAPDRVPIDYLANPGIDARLKRHFGLPPGDEEGLRQALKVDFRQLNPVYVGPPLHEQVAMRQVDMWGIRTRWIEHESGGYWDYCEFPLRDAGREEIEAWPMPAPDDFDYRSFAEQCARFRDYYLLLGGPGSADIINSTGMIRGMEQTLMDLVTDDEAGLRYIDRRNEVQLEVLRRALEAAGGQIDMLWIGEDLGTQKGPIISLELYRKHLRPRHQRYVDLARSFGIPVMCHTCGSSSWAYEDFIEMGIAAVDTLQPEAAKMAPDYLKGHFGGRLAFHGCISTAGPVAYGTAEETARAVRETLAIMKPGGGYAFSPTHLLQDNSPTENVLAMYQAAWEFGSY